MADHRSPAWFRLRDSRHRHYEPRRHTQCAHSLLHLGDLGQLRVGERGDLGLVRLAGALLHAGSLLDQLGGRRGLGDECEGPVFVDGEKTVTLKGETIALEFKKIVDDYVRSRYGAAAAGKSETIANKAAV